MDPKKKKIYGVLIAFGFTALVVDRFVMSDPSAVVASLAQSEGGSGNADSQAALTDDGQAVAVTAQTFPDNLSPLPASQLRDAFQLTPSARQSLRPVEKRDEPDEAGGDIQVQKKSAAEFAAGHRLEAVMRGASVNIAVLDGVWINIGDIVDGWKLTNITGRAAIFENRNNRVELVVYADSD